MHTKRYLLFILLLFAEISFGQSRILGEAKNIDGNPLAFANVLLLKKADSTLVKGEIVPENGKFAFSNIKNGEYLLTVSMVGYQKVFSKAIKIDNISEQTIEPLIAQTIESNLKEVSVSAKKPLFEQQVDRLVINVASSITASGGNALEVLQRSPGITLDKQSSSLRMNGKGGVMVMINGKLTRLPMDAVLQLLEGMSANNIEKIELISTPPASYDAEGDAGLINIITKRNLDFGTNGTFSGTLGQGWYFRPAASLALNYRSKNLNIYGDYSFSNNQNRGGWNAFTTNDNYYNIFNIRRDHSLPNHFAKIGFDYTLSKQTILSGLISVFNTHADVNSPSTSSNYVSSTNQTLTKTTDVEAFQGDTWKNLMMNVGLRHVFKNKNEWSIDIDKLYYHNNNPSNNQFVINDLQLGSISHEQLKVEKYSPVNLWVLKTDYNTKINDKTMLNVGLKGSFTNLNNNMRLDRFREGKWSEDTRFTQRFDFNEDILASYANLSKTLNNKTKIQAGLRFEHTSTLAKDINDAVIVSRNYGNFFPTFLLSHKYNKIHTFNVSYNRRITRPSYKLLVPMTLFVDVNTLFSGNPYLLPTISDNIQLNWVLKEKYSFSVRYNNDKNTMFQYQPKFNAITKELIYYTENMGKMETVAFTSSIPIKYTKWWQSQNNLTGYRQSLQTNFQETPLNRSLWNVQFNTSHTITLPRKITTELSYYYVSPNFFGIFKNLSRSEFVVGIQKVLPNNKGTLRFNVSDIFWTNQGRWKGAIPAKNFYQDVNFFSEPRVMRLTYNRSFGNQKVKANQIRKTGSEEERQRF